MQATECSQNRQLKLVNETYSQIQKVVHTQLKSAALQMIISLFDEEVTKLCGPAFSRKQDSLYHRGGSDPGSVILHGQRIKVKKPRVKKNGKEVQLDSYQALQKFDLMCDKVMKYMLAGVSTRNYSDLLDEIEGGLGLKKSSVSRVFAKGSKEALDEINGRDLSKLSFITIMLDGIYIAQRSIIVALGITSEGKKIILGLREGNSENGVVCTDLLESLKERGLDANNPLLFVIDGSKALKTGIRRSFGKHHPVQRCTLHKERNILNYLPKQFQREFRRRWKLVHGCISYEMAAREYDKLYSWLNNINYQAGKSLEEAEMETLTVIKLNVPYLLRQSLHSTNSIESAFSRIVEKTARVKNWTTSADQVVRWAAISLLDTESKFTLIRGHKQIPVLMEELRRLNIDSLEKVS